MIYCILIASLFDNVQILLGEFRCRLLSGLTKHTAASFAQNYTESRCSFTPPGMIS